MKFNDGFDEVREAINKGIIPDKDYKFNDDFDYMGRIYIANGTVKYKGKIYGFCWNHDEGIIESTIEEETN